MQSGRSHKAQPSRFLLVPAHSITITQVKQLFTQLPLTEVSTLLD